MFTLDQVVPWGRSFDEYRAMFALTSADLGCPTLDCGAGPASFTAEAAARAGNVVACDPIYHFDVSQIEARIAATFDDVMEQTRRNQAEFVWRHIRSLEELAAVRRSAMHVFLTDLRSPVRPGRYVAGELPRLPFGDGSFHIALSSHLLFLYTEQLTEAFHVDSILEMCRVADEARVFPMTALGAVPSRHVDPVVTKLRQCGCEVRIETVEYEFQRGGDQMMRIRRHRHDWRTRPC